MLFYHQTLGADRDDSSSSSSSSSDCSYEEESISSDEESSYQSIDRLSVILEETDQDLRSEVSSRRGTRRSYRSLGGGSSRRSGRSLVSLQSEDFPPSPPKRTWNPSSTKEEEHPDDATPTTTTSEDNEEEEEEYTESLKDHSSSAAAHKEGVPLTCIQTGQTIFVSAAGEEDDDEFTFVSCTTTDEMSYVSDLGSSRHERSLVFFAEAGSSNNSSRHGRTTVGSLGDETIEISDHLRGEQQDACVRRGSGFSLDSVGDLMLTMIPEAEDDEKSDSSSGCDAVNQEPLNFQAAQGFLQEQMVIISQPIFAVSATNKTARVAPHKLQVLRHRLRVERYSGLRRRKGFERSRKMLDRNLRLTKSHTTPRNAHKRVAVEACQNKEDEEEESQEDRLARFGGLTRRQSFRNTKSEFEKKFEAHVQAADHPLRRRRSLSPVLLRQDSSFSRLVWIERMSQSEGALVVDRKSDTTPKSENIFQRQQERFGGLQRRNSFQRCRRLFTKRFEKLQARSKEEKERFGGLRRLESYKQSRQLFQSQQSNGFVENNNVQVGFLRTRAEGCRVQKPCSRNEWAADFGSSQRAATPAV